MLNFKIFWKNSTGARLRIADEALLPLDDAFLTIAAALAGSGDLRLLRAGYQAKYGNTVDYTQVLHFDYPNHSLVVPADNDIVGFFLYLTEVTPDLGPTMLVSDTVRGPLRPDRTHLAPAADYPGMSGALDRVPGLPAAR